MSYEKTLQNDGFRTPGCHDPVLASDIGLFVNDLIEGKGADNVILCKGSYGLGKTLTAEIYSEVMKRPLYPIHSGVESSNR